MKESFLRWRENNREEKRAEGKEKWERGHRPVLIVLCVLFGLYALTIIYPLVWMLINSLKTKQEFLNNPWPLPQELMFNNYAEVFKFRLHAFQFLVFESYHSYGFVVCNGVRLVRRRKIQVPRQKDFVLHRNIYHVYPDDWFASRHVSAHA